MPPDYMAECGSSNSVERLKKIANIIASFARNAKRKQIPPDKAMEYWESELEWLKSNYYRGSFRFKWPSICVKL